MYRGLSSPWFPRGKMSTGVGNEGKGSPSVVVADRKEKRLCRKLVKHYVTRSTTNVVCVRT